MEKSFKYRIYPNDEQKVLLAKTFGSVRYVYNKFLYERIKLYEDEKKSMSYIDNNNFINRVMKKDKETEWLKEVDKFSLTNSLRHLDSAYKNFFREIKKGNTKQGFPKFKSKNSHKYAYTTNFTNNNIEVSFENNKIKLPKLKWIKAAVHRKLPDCKIFNATISQSPSGKYHVSICFDTQDDTELYLPISQNEVGIDVGIKDVVTTSDGVVYENKRLTKNYESKLTKEQRRLSKKKKGSNNRNKQRIKVARVHEKISNIRKDYLHKISKQLINENQVIISEDLDVKKMVQDKKFSKSISDVGWGEFFRQLEYKAKWYNRTYHKVDRYFPSSQMCSNCKHINTEMKDLSIRTWTCKKCKTFHLRDKCSAINMLDEGQRVLALI